MFSLRSIVVASIAVATVLAAPTHTNVQRAVAEDLNHQLVGEPTALGRFKLLNSSVNNFIFDFVAAREAAQPNAGKDGNVILGTAGNFPAAVGNGVAMGVGFMGPCGLNVPHWHNRASELLIAIGGALTFGTFQENGATFITGQIKDHQATMFPAGSLHFQQNLACEPAQFVAAFGSEDPGRIDAAPGFFKNLPADIDAISLGDIGVKEVKNIAGKIPKNVAWGVQECLDRCGLKRSGQWTPEAIAKAKRQFTEFMEQGPINARDFDGLPMISI